MPNFQRSKPPIPNASHPSSMPDIPQSAQNNPYTTGRQPAIPSFPSNTIRKSRFFSISGFRPVVGAGFLCLLAVFSTIAGTSVSRSIYDYDSPTVDWSESSKPLMEAGTPTYFFSGKDLIVTIPIEKPDELHHVYSSDDGTIRITYKTPEGAMEDGAEQIEEGWFMIPDMDFFNHKMYVSTRIINSDFAKLKPEDILNVEVSLGSPAYVESVSEFGWAIDGPENASEEDILKSLSSSQQFARYTIEVTDDGVADQNGVVIAKVTKPFTPDISQNEYNSDFYISGKCNILFKKDGKVVFADVYNYPNETSNNNTFTLAYSAPYDLPEYDSVEVIDLR